VTVPADIEKAKQLLKEAGYDGQPIVILDPTDLSDLHAVSLYMAQQLRAAGANVDLQAMDWSTLTSRRGVKEPADKGGWNLMPTYLGGLEAASPLTNQALAASCDKAWFGWPCDEKLETLRTEWRREPDLEKRKDIARQIQERAYEVVPYVPYGQFFTMIVRKDNLKGFQSQAPMPIYWGVSRVQ
jgi:peptide/nickel transport system substrate-binding protein